MNEIIRHFNSWTSLIPVFSLRNLIEVIIIAVIVYEFLAWIVNSRTFILLKGIIVICGFTFICMIFRLDTILWIMERVSTIAVISLLIVFQPEMRKALEQLGSKWKNLIPGLINKTDHDSLSIMTESTALEISKAVFEMAKKMTGALIVIEQGEDLEDVIKTGIAVKGIVSSGLLINIFEKNTPLHDGAVIIRGNTVEAATCYLPLSENMSISKSYGTRHRAALGISEISDSVTIVVSEETGMVSVVQNGEITRIAGKESLDMVLRTLIKTQEVSRFGNWFKSRGKDNEKADN